MIYSFYTEFANAEEFTKTNRSAEWKDICGWCLGNGVRICCFPVAIDDKIQAFFFCEVKNGTLSEQEVLERLKRRCRTFAQLTKKFQSRLIGIGL